jgi:hypothetical protein
VSLVHFLSSRWGFLAIYFVPGISEEQINNYIRRLAPQRRDFLNRRGLGYLFGNGFMRALIGENRWRQQAIVGNIVEHPMIQEMGPSARGLAFDSDGESTASGAPTRELELPTPVAGTFSLSLPPLPTIPNQEDDARGTSDGNQDNNQHGQFESHQDLIISAMQDVVWGYARWAGGSAFLMAHEYILEPALLISGSLGLGISFLSMGAGIWQYSRPRSTTIAESRPLQFFMGAPFLIGTGLFGGVIAGGMIYARSAIRSFAMGSLGGRATSKSTNPQAQQPKRFR